MSECFTSTSCGNIMCQRILKLLTSIARKLFSPFMDIILSQPLTTSLSEKKIIWKLLLVVAVSVAVVYSWPRHFFFRTPLRYNSPRYAVVCMRIACGSLKHQSVLGALYVTVCGPTAGNGGHNCCRTGQIIDRGDGALERSFIWSEIVNSAQRLVFFSLLRDFRSLCSVSFLRLSVGVSTVRGTKQVFVLN